MSISTMGNRRRVLMVLAFCTLVIVVAPKPAEAISCTRLNNKLKYHHSEGRRYFKEKRFSKSEQQFDKLLYYLRKGEKKSTGLWRGCKFISRERFYQRYSMGYTWRGASKYFQGKYRSAINDYQSAIKKDYKNTLARYMLGIAYNRVGDKNSAREQYRILRRKNSKYAPKLYRIINR